MPEPQTPPPCPHCGTPRSGRFCEVDGYDFDTGSLHTARLAALRTAEAIRAAVGDDPAAPAAGRARPLIPAQRGGSGPHPAVPPGGPAALITADRAYFDSVIAQMGPDASALTFPPYCPKRRVPLAGEQVRIGRRSASRALLPEIDLSGPPEDPGVSHLHAVLLARPGGSWALVDPGSTNGTTLNGGTDPIEVNVPVPVTDGDRIHVGAWTTITLQEGRP
ncbi:FHA domain-containing protein [Actinomadura sp. KC216]|uniref:FHA domain-containing protein n=1 Tax=Actinomadura sp. KC216 TaxID=2530370 RepID=UPI001047A157|nr:FHA domain-containing protein [Actinomadura sp. KC216]TDB87955.1 FHA domain-containing protein [Actinomadura sp. KC216]